MLKVFELEHVDYLIDKMSDMPITHPRTDKNLVLDRLRAALLTQVGKDVDFDKLSSLGEKAINAAFDEMDIDE